MSRPPIKALKSIKNYCEKTQCRRCVFGFKANSIGDTDFVGCKLQETNPCDWNIPITEPCELNIPITEIGDWNTPITDEGGKE